jgi:MFS family permease
LNESDVTVSTRPMLRNRDFVLLFAGQGVSRLGDGLYTAAVAWLAWTFSHDPASVALVTVAANLPTFLATVVGASYADRYDRRKLLARMRVLTGFASALTDIPLVALVQRRIPDRHLAKVFGLWDGGIAGAIAPAPVIAAFLIAHVGVRTGFMLSGAALIALAAAAALILARAGALRPAERAA